MRVLLPLKNKSGLDSCSETSSVETREENEAFEEDFSEIEKLAGATALFPSTITTEVTRQNFGTELDFEDKKPAAKVLLKASEKSTKKATVEYNPTLPSKDFATSIASGTTATQPQQQPIGSRKRQAAQISQEHESFSVAKAVGLPQVTPFVAVGAASKPSSTVSSSSSPSKRSRPDSKPAARPLVVTAKAPVNQLGYTNNQTSFTDNDGAKMAGGARRRYDSDDEDGRENNCAHPQHAPVQLLPAENEPPSLRNKPLATLSPSKQVAKKPQAKDDPANEGNPVADSGAQHQTDFIKALKKQGLETVEQDGDGNCLFRAVSLQVYGDSEQHAEVRERCMDFMANNEEHYSNFVAADSNNESAGESFAEYIARKRKLGVHGNHAEIQAISELYNRPIEVYTPGSYAPSNNNQEPKLQPMNIFHSEYKTSDVPIRLSYHDGNHYNAIIDPLVPTAGLGLGLPGLQPGLADKMQLAAAVKESDQLADQMELERVLKESASDHQRRSVSDEDDDLQRALKESSYSVDYTYEKKAMALSDLDATNFELEQEALAKSWDSYGHQEHGRKQQASASNVAAGRRRPRPTTSAASTPSSASFPTFAESTSSVAAIPPAASMAASSSVASAAAAASSYPEHDFDAGNEYPQVVQELVMNGFELKRVVRAYELVGDNFDDLLAFLISTSG